MMMRITFSRMDSDGDGTISLAQIQAAHGRIFKAIDADRDSRLTLEEMQAFMQEPRDRFHGSRGSLPARRPCGR